MKTPPALILSLLLLLITHDCLAQSKFSFTGQIRQRSEIDGRDFNADEADPDFHLLRTRLGLTVDVSTDIKAFIQIQDSRHFGSGDVSQGRGSLDGTAPGLDFHQAWIGIDQLFGSSLSAKLGRQKIGISNQRLVGEADWSNIGRTYDALVISSKSGTSKLDFFAAQLVENADRTAGHNIYGFNGSFVLSGQFNLDSFFFLDNNTNEIVAGADEGKNQLNRFSVGGRGWGKANAIKYEVEAIYQGGATSPAIDAARLDISAFLLSLSIGYTLPSESAELGALYAFLSGDEDPLDDKHEAFSTILGTNHKFYGFMDYFPRLLANGGLHDIAASLSFPIEKKGNINAQFHHFRSAQITANSSDIFGNELDLTGSYGYTQNLKFQAGASVFFPGELFDVSGAQDTAYSFYFMTVLNF